VKITSRAVPLLIIQSILAELGVIGSNLFRFTRIESSSLLVGEEKEGTIAIPAKYAQSKFDQLASGKTL
jgi:hypothetical protein